jgi:hypothetical protein
VATTRIIIDHEWFAAAAAAATTTTTHFTSWRVVRFSTIIHGDNDLQKI